MKRGLAILLILVCAAALLIALSRGKTLTTGRCLAADTGAYLIVDRNGSPIVMRNRSWQEDLFDGLKTGDKIWILHDGVATSYPGSTGVYGCWVLGSGSLDDIPEDTLSSLAELGWTFS